MQIRRFSVQKFITMNSRNYYAVIVGCIFVGVTNNYLAPRHVSCTRRTCTVYVSLHVKSITLTKSDHQISIELLRPRAGGKI